MTSNNEDNEAKVISSHTSYCEGRNLDVASRIEVERVVLNLGRLMRETRRQNRGGEGQEDPAK